MTLKQMDIDPNNFALEHAYSYSDIISETGPSTIAIRIPNGDITSIAYQIEGNGKVQATVYPEEDIISDSALWEDVPEDNEILPAVSAIRLVSNDGAAILNVRCQ